MSLKKTSRVQLWVGLSIIGTLTFSGCSNTDSPPATETNQSRAAEPSSATAPADLVALNQVQQKMVGTWLGEAFIDTARLQEKLQTMTPSRREDVLNLADEFLTTVMAVDFRADGTQEQEMELTTLDGQPIRDGGSGRWRVVKANADQVLVETETKLTDGTVVTDQLLYRISTDGNQLAQVIELGHDFDGCGPIIILRRQHLPETKVAEQTDSATSQR